MGLRNVLCDSTWLIMIERDAKLLANLSSRHFRKKNGLCLAEGLRCCEEALMRRPDDVKALFCTESFIASQNWPRLKEALGKVRLSTLTDREFASLSETETPQGVLAVMKIPEYTPPKAAGNPFTLILDRVADPGNMGTILRTAWAVGLDSCWLVKGSADPFSPKSIRAGMGAQFALGIHLFDSLEEAVAAAKDFGVENVWCTLPSEGISIFDDGFRCRGSALIIGNEANGISNPKLGRAVTIPMPGNAESLNAAQAATVFLVDSLRETVAQR